MVYPQVSCALYTVVQNNTTPAKYLAVCELATKKGTK